MYPKKPIEVADDLESFAHVLAYAALRFHEHNRSKARFPDPTTKLSKNDLRKLNESNRNLANYIQQFFYDEDDCGGYAIGGERKLAAIARGKPGFRLLSGPNGEVPLAQLLEDLYDLLRQHYAALDVTQLQQYDVQIQQSQRSRNIPERVASAVPYANLLPRTGPLPRRRSERQQAVPKLATWPGDSPPIRVLDNHNAMHNVLWSFWWDANEMASECAGDKTLDQLYGIVQIIERRPINASGTIIGKRKASKDPSRLPLSKHPKLGDSSESADKVDDTDDADEVDEVEGLISVVGETSSYSTE